MRLEKIVIENFRSIEKVSINLPENKPLILFGPNNAGKSNILSALDRLLGERYPTYIECEDSDYFMRDNQKYPTIKINAQFDDFYHYNNNGRGYKTINLVYGYDATINDNRMCDGDGTKLFISSDSRERFQSFLLDAERNASYHFNYSNKFSLLSKLNKSLHNSLTEFEREQLTQSFENIKNVFEVKSEFSDMFGIFKNSIDESVKGFVHHLEADFSAYDPNNYAKTLRINAYEDENVRSFDEFGTGEQQILIMAFAKAYMQTFKGESFIFILEEPEANLHPLAQKWLKKYIYDLCESGLQIVISTHSPHFINPSNLEGLVRVYKENGITNIKQLSKEDLHNVLVQTGVPEDRIEIDSIGDYFDLRLYSEQFEGMFAEKIILVEGLTERLSLPIWLEKENYFLSANGVEIINCMGKANIPTLYRIYSAFGYKCICLFDGDLNKINSNDRKNVLMENILPDFLESNCYTEDGKKYYIMNYGENYICFGKDYESTIKAQIGNERYDSLVEEAKAASIENKQGIAKYIAINYDNTPKFITKLIELLNCKSNENENNIYYGDVKVDYEISF